MNVLKNHALLELKNAFLFRGYLFSNVSRRFILRLSAKSAGGIFFRLLKMANFMDGHYLESLKITRKIQKRSGAKS